MKALYFSTLLAVTSLVCAAPAPEKTIAPLLRAKEAGSGSTIICKPHFHAKPKALSITPLGSSPSKARSFYGFDKVSGTGTGQSIAIIDAYGSPTIQKDLDTFCTTYGLPKTTVQIHYPSGVPTTTDKDWAMETSLDVEWAHAIAPGAAIHLVISPDASDNKLLAAVDYAVSLGAKQVSMSWGSDEFSGQSTYSSHFNVPGVSFFASSGDNGAGVSWPAVDPSVVGVGGTTLYYNVFGCTYNEKAWSGSGGGTSKYTGEPTYQGSFQTSTKRMVPDVSYDADPMTGFAVYMTNMSVLGGWGVIGGTSAGAPQWAALMALVNSMRKAPLQNVLSVLYQLGDPKTRTLYFRDITSGGNGGYNAATGYDEVTGLGTPHSDKLVSMLVSK